MYTYAGGKLDWHQLQVEVYYHVIQEFSLIKAADVLPSNGKSSSGWRRWIHNHSEKQTLCSHQKQHNKVTNFAKAHWLSQRLNIWWRAPNHIAVITVFTVRNVEGWALIPSVSREVFADWLRSRDRKYRTDEQMTKRLQIIFTDFTCITPIYCLLLLSYFEVNLGSKWRKLIQLIQHNSLDKHNKTTLQTTEQNMHIWN